MLIHIAIFFLVSFVLDIVSAKLIGETNTPDGVFCPLFILLLVGFFLYDLGDPFSKLIIQTIDLCSVFLVIRFFVRIILYMKKVYW